MRELKVRFIGKEHNDAKRIIADRIAYVLRASISGYTGFLSVVNDQTTNVDLEFVLFGEPTNLASVTIGLTDEDRISADMCELITAGVDRPANIKEKIAQLDNDEYRVKFLIKDSWKETFGLDEEDVIRESQLVENPSLLDNCSQLVIISDRGNLLTSRLAMLQGCLPFSIGNHDEDGSWVCICTSIEDFIAKANMIASEGGSAKAMERVIKRVFTKDMVTARNARSYIGSKLLTSPLKSDFGLLALEIGDARIWEKIERERKQNDPQ